MERILASSNIKVDLVFNETTRRYVVRTAIDGKHSSSYKPTSDERIARTLYELVKHHDCPRCGDHRFATRATDEAQAIIEA